VVLAILNGIIPRRAALPFSGVAPGISFPCFSVAVLTSYPSHEGGESGPLLSMVNIQALLNYFF